MYIALSWMKVSQVKGNDYYASDFDLNKTHFNVLLHLYIRHLRNNFPPLQVTIFFNGKLFRGNKSTKVNAKSLSVFDSPSYPPLAKLSNNGGSKCITFY